MTRADFFGMAQREGEALSWSPLQSGDSPAALSTWKKAAAAVPGSGLLLVRGLQRLAEGKVEEGGVELEATTASLSSGEREDREPRRPLARHLALRQDEDVVGSSCSETTVATPKRARRHDERAAPVCEVGLALMWLDRPHSGAGPAQREKMRRMMHKVVPDQLFSAEVRRVATSEEIGAAFRLEPGFVERHWVVSSSSKPASGDVSEEESSIEENVTPGGSQDVDPLMRGMSHEMQLEIGLSRPIEHNQLSLALWKLERDADCRTSGRCGFSKVPSVENMAEHCHPALEVSSSNRLVSRPQRSSGLYYTARAAASITSASEGSFYFEFSILSMDPKSAVSVGLSTGNLKVRDMVGAAQCSVGYHSSGNAVCENRWSKSSSSFESGDVIGCLVNIVPTGTTTAQGDAGDSCYEEGLAGWPTGSGSASGCFERSRSGHFSHRGSYVEIYFFKNGERSAGAPCCLYLDEDGELHPSVSIYRDAARVELRCCGRTILPRGVDRSVVSICHGDKLC